MALKPVYVIDGRRWIPIARAATLLATGAATIKRLMADGALEWAQSSRGSRTLVVDEAGVLRLRQERGVAGKELKIRANASTRTAAERRASMRSAAPAVGDDPPARSFGAFDRTWDPSPSVPPISGRKPTQGG